MLNLSNISFSYSGIPAIQGISLDVMTGDVIGILGPNGAGKSTLIKLINGSLRPTEGSISIDGSDIGEISIRERAKTMATLGQGAKAPFGFTALEIVLMGRTPYVSALGFESKSDIEIAMEAMRKTDSIDFMHRRIGQLSGGEKQRVFLARALAQQPKMLILDEPTTFLDIRHTAQLKALIGELNGDGITFICALHDINLAASMCNRLVLMKEGRVHVTGKSQDIINKANIDETFGVDIRIATDSGQNPRVLI